MSDETENNEFATEGVNKVLTDEEQDMATNDAELAAQAVEEEGEGQLLTKDYSEDDLKAVNKAPEGDEDEGKAFEFEGTYMAAQEEARRRGGAKTIARAGKGRWLVTLK